MAFALPCTSLHIDRGNEPLFIHSIMPTFLRLPYFLIRQCEHGLTTLATNKDFLFLISLLIIKNPFSSNSKLNSKAVFILPYKEVRKPKEGELFL